MQYPAGILPFGKANAELDRPFFNDSVAYEPPCKSAGKPVLEFWLTTVIDDAQVIEGAPAHVQIVGKPMMDEELLKIMQVVESVLKGASE